VSATQYCAYAFVTTVGVGVALSDGVVDGLVEMVCGVVGVGVGEADLPQPLTRRTNDNEAVRTAYFLDFFMSPIYPVCIEVETDATM